jgi:Fe-S oxidoreductase
MLDDSLSMEISGSRVQEAIGVSGDTIIITVCPTCEIVLIRETLRMLIQRGEDIEAINFWDFLD